MEVVWLALALLVLWEVAARAVPTLFFPPFSTIALTFSATWLSSDPLTLFTSEVARDHAIPSMLRFFAGYGAAALMGITFGVVLGHWRTAGAFFNPLIRFGMSIPATALLPIAILLFGITSAMNIALIAVACLWPILINTLDGVRSIDTTWLQTARSLRLNRVRYFSAVVLPAASPSILAGMRISVGIGLILIVGSEFYAATEGIGYFLVISQRLFRLPELWATVLLLALIGIALNVIFTLIEHRLLRWHYGARASAEFA